MTQDDIFALFGEARALIGNDRQAFLAKLPDDVRHELESLLEHDTSEEKTPALARRMRDIVEEQESRTLDETASSPQPDLPSTRYPITGTIGQGGMGVVLRAQDDKLRRDVAMKILLPEPGSAGTPTDATRMRRFVEEAQITGQLDHPGVVPVHELGDDEKGQTYFTMRLVKGITLGDVFERVKAGDSEWTQTRALSALLRMCETVAFAHSRGIIHRDLKPSNVMVGKFGEAYVMDWGIAKVLGQGDTHDIRVDTSTTAATEIRTDRADDESRNDESPLLTMDGDVVGTPAYMAPEQARGEVEQVAQPADVYAMGAILYQLLTGERPYRSRGERLSPRMIHAQVIAGPPDPVLELAPRASPELVAICEKAMARTIQDRYPDMGEMSEDLRAYLENRVVKAHRTGALIELKKWVQRNKGMAAALMSTLVVIGVGVAGYLYLTVKAKEAAEESEQAITKSKADLVLQKIAVEQSLKVVQDMLSSADPNKLRGPDYTVRQMLDDFENSEALRDLTGTPRVLATVHSTLGSTYYGLGDFEKARGHHEIALGLRRSSFGDKHPDVATSLGNLAGVLKEQGELDESERLSRKSLEMMRSSLDSEHPNVATAINNLAVHLSSQGKFEEAEELFREALELRRRIFGDQHPSVAVSISGIAGVLRAQRKFKEAEERLRDVLVSRRHLLGDQHPDVARSLNDLAVVLTDEGKIEEAVDLHREALKIRRRILGGVHPDVAESLYGIARVLTAQNKLQEAVGLHREALEMRRRTLGERHPEVAASLSSLGSVLGALGKREEAASLHREALAIARYVHGDESLDVATVLNNLAVVLYSQGKFHEAEELLREALIIDKQNGSAQLQQTLDNLLALIPADTRPLDRAKLLTEYQRAEGAIPILEGLLQETSNLGAKPLEIRIWLGAALSSLGQFDEAEEQLTETYFQWDDSMENVAHLKVVLVERLIMLYEKWEMPDDAADWREELSELQGEG